MTELTDDTWEQIAAYLPEDLTGWRALDIGCGNGARALALAQRGADVLGIDTDAEALASARAAAVRLGLEAQAVFDEQWVYDLASRWERYDLMLFAGVFSRLRYPLLGLDIAARKARRLFVFQDVDTPGLEAIIRSAGLRVLNAVAPGTYVCEPDAAFADTNREYLAAAALTPRLTRTLTFEHCWVNSVPGYTETCYHDGTRVTATPEDSEQYRANAALFGYGSDTAALSREHEILHTFLAEALGFGSSPTLWAVAHGQSDAVAPIWEQEEEESWTLAFQSYLHGGPLTDPLGRFIDAGYSLPTLREEARRLLR